MTRKPIIVLVLVAATLLGATRLGNAQSVYSGSAQSPYSYPWCAIDFSGPDPGGMSCYYASWEQCRATMSGIGGNCIRSPYYRAQATPLPHRALAKPRHHRHA